MQPNKSLNQTKKIWDESRYCPCGSGECEKMRDRFRKAGLEVGNHTPRESVIGVNEGAKYGSGA